MHVFRRFQPSFFLAAIGLMVVLRPAVAQLELPPPPLLAKTQRLAVIEVTYTDFTPEAQAAFQMAIDIWESLLVSVVPIRVNAVLAPGVVISTPNQVRDFPGAPLANTWYPAGLADAIAGQDLQVGEFDLDIYMASNGPWYFGLDGNPPQGRLDFVKIVLHELAHGLGFFALFKVEDGRGAYGTVGRDDLFFDVPLAFGRLDLAGFPSIFERFVVNEASQHLTDASLFANDSPALAEQLGSDALYFNGPNAVSAADGLRPRLFTPPVYGLGSSLTHLDRDTYGQTVNALLTVGSSLTIHSPGPITLAILQDIGWEINQAALARSTLVESISWGRLKETRQRKYLAAPDAAQQN